MRKSIDIEVQPKQEKEGKKTNLLKVLASLKPGLSSKAIVEQTDHYLFFEDKISTYNEMICISCPFDIGFSGSVKAIEFYKLLASISSEEISLELEKGQIVVETKSSSFGMAYSDSGPIHDLVKAVIFKDLSWRTLPKGLKQAIVLCSFSASKNMTTPYLTGVCVKGQDVMSSDDYRVSWYELEKGLRRAFLIPASSAVCLREYEFEEYCLETGWMYFKDKDGLVFGARLLGEEFPAEKAKSIFPQKEREGFALPKELKKAVDKTAVLMQSDPVLDRKLTLTFFKEGKKNRVKAEAKKKEVGWFSEIFDMEEGPEKEFSITINPVFLEEILNYAVILCPVSETHVLFLSDNFKHFVSLD